MMFWVLTVLKDVQVHVINFDVRNHSFINITTEKYHSLWVLCYRYVLLKERNMLLTLEQEAKRQRLPMPSPERLEKVRPVGGRVKTKKNKCVVPMFLVK
jgi:hypothetical protein